MKDSVEVGDKEGDSEDASIKKRQTVLDKLNEVMEKEVAIDKESKEMLNSLSDVKEGIDMMREDMKLSAKQISKK